jgi:hypothetical protein
MPGSGRCARCGASLALATAAIDVHPPRAGRMWRFQLAFWRLWHRLENLRSKASSVLPAFGSGNDVVSFDLGTMLRCVVPGWPQFRRGDRPRAFVFFFSYLFLLVPGVILCGSWLGSLLLGLAGAMHVAAVADAVVTTFATPSDRISFTLMAGLVLCFVLYLPVGWLISRVATPISINANIPPFQRGEVLWYSRIATPATGDLVVFTMPTLRSGNYILQGQWIGRVIAMPGQTVSVNKGQCYVDGVLSEWKPALHVSLNDGYTKVVPEGKLFVYPDGVVALNAPLSQDIIEQLYFVAVSRIAGQLYFRSLPLSQMSTL